MFIFDKFKKSIKPAESEEAKKTPKRAVEGKKAETKEAPKAEKAEVKRVASSAKRVEKKQFSEAYRILESPHVTEKAGDSADKNNSYVFKVNSAANKNEVKQAVQDLYGVVVELVNIINIPRKARRVGRNEGFKQGFKKAIVKLVEGEKIEIMPR